MIRAAELPLDAFLLSFEAPYVLLVAVGDASSELAAALAQTKPEQMTFRTEMVVTEVELPPRTESAELRLAKSLRAAALPISTEVLKSCCHALPLPRRSDDGHTSRVTVGRGPDNDIVLRHRTVSKLHGWIEVDSDRSLYLGDANSTNHTFVNGTRVTGPVEVHPGCSVRFGGVESYVYRTQSLWQLFHP